MSNNNQNQTIQPSIEHKPYSENTAYITDTIKQQYQAAQTKFNEPQVQEKWGQVKNIVIDRTKEFGFLTLDYAVKTFEITKTTLTDLYGVYKQ